MKGDSLQEIHKTEKGSAPGTCSVKPLKTSAVPLKMSGVRLSSTWFVEVLGGFNDIVIINETNFFRKKCKKKVVRKARTEPMGKIALYC